MNETPELKLSGTYPELWAEVDSLEDKGLTESALKVVDAIYEKATAEGNEAQTVKALIHIAKYTGRVQDDALPLIIERFRTEIDKAKGPLKRILQSTLAQFFWNYYQENRWQFTSRTEVVKFERNDIRTWDLKTISNEAVSLHLASLENAAELQQIPLSRYNEILEKGTDSELYRPTLYDFLAFRALDLLANEEAFVSQPAYRFELNEAKYFAPAAEFANLKVEARDTGSFRLKALHIYQELSRAHLKQAAAEPLVDAELHRLRFVRQVGVMENKDSLYIRALDALETSLAGKPAAAQVAWYRAMFWSAEGNEYNAQAGEMHRWHKVKAKEICDRAQQQYAGAKYTASCKALAETLLDPSMNFQVAHQNPVHAPFRLSVDYRNLDKVYLRIFQISDKAFKDLRDEWGEDLAALLLKQPLVRKWEQALPNPGDLQMHRVQVPVEALAPGRYAVAMSNNAEFSVQSNGVTFQYIWISELAYTVRSSNGYEGGDHEIVAYHRLTGQPLAGVSLVIHSEEYNYSISRYVDKIIANLKTDAQGMAVLKAPAKNNYRNYSVEMILDKDRYWDESNNSQYSRTFTPPVTTYNTVLFTDRAIYRPGQTIYYKGMMMETHDKTTKIRPGQSTTVTFYDVNSQVVATQDVKSNEYGTFSGSFVAPVGLLNGQMRIQENHGSINFRVEEYKRPKFEVKFDPVKGSFRLNDEVKVKGNAKAYAGSNIDGAKVQYRVVRNASLPAWYYWWRVGPSRPSMVILNGETTTDENGEFEVSFKALADPSIPAQDNPTFTYTVYADVTDISGETRSSSVYTRVGYTAIEASIDVPESFDRESDPQFRISTRNLNGQFETAKGRIKVSRVKMPAQPFHENLFSQPDLYVLSKAEFERMFPGEVYKDEDRMETWPMESVVFSGTFDSEKDDTLKLAEISAWKEGAYLIELESQDKFGKAVSWKQYFTVFSLKEKTAPVNDIFWFHMPATTCEPGDTATFAVASRSENAWLYYELEHKGVIKKKEWIKLSNSKFIGQIPVTEDMRGNFHFTLGLMRNGEFRTVEQTVYVPWTNRELKLEFETFRDKLLPGATETWKVKVSGPLGERIAAEMLAGMYDASLDAFATNSWGLSVNPYWYASRRYVNTWSNEAHSGQMISYNWPGYHYGYTMSYDRLNWFGTYFAYYYYRGGYTGWADEGDDFGGEDMELANVTISKSTKGAAKPKAPAMMDEKNNEAMPVSEDESREEQKESGDTLLEGEKSGADKDLGGEVKVRSNLNELAFFYPQLQTNENGEVIFTFTVPEALTRWNFRALAHTQDLKTGTLSGTTVTQKELMVMPNPPRFLRENDLFTFSAKVSNLSEGDLSGIAWLEIYDAMTLKPIDAAFGNLNAQRNFDAKKGQSAALSWDLKIPEGVSAIVYRVKARAGTFTDGEESTLPVLTNRMLVIESMPLPVRPNQSKTFTFDKLLNNQSSTLKHHSLTLEFTSNPAWYAVQALPYLMEYPYECSEQTFSRFYANSLASHIANSHPRIKAVFEAWEKQSPGNEEALLSKLEKNEELKYLLLEETPWVLNAQDETERKKRVALLFELHRMSREMDAALNKLIKAQVASGGWPWFKGGPEDRYITQHIITGMGKLDRLGVRSVRGTQKSWNMVIKGVAFLDRQIVNDYNDLKRYKVDMSLDHLGYAQIHYLYMRSFFLTGMEVPGFAKEAYDYYMGQAKKFWLDKSRYMQGMLAIAFNRNNDPEQAKGIVRSLRENSMKSDELGMYWKENVGGYYWWQAPIEFQAMMIEAFEEVGNETAAVEEMKLWLLKSKQTTDWKTTRATVEACYALLLRGTDFLAESQMATIKMGGQTIDPVAMGAKTEAGTGYFKVTWKGEEVKQDMGRVEVSNPNQVAAWGAVYWQYFEQLDKITPSETPLKLKKDLFLQKQTDTGPVLVPLAAGATLTPGDLVKVRVEIRVDRDMEYVHMKDMRASGFEPVNVLSQYKWQDGLGYYESTRDAATNFFFHWLPKGTYVFEYPLRVTHKGDFSNGVTTIQCMYAPEFTAHSQGIRVTVK